jgi:hypothetical protein
VQVCPDHARSASQQISGVDAARFTQADDGDAHPDLLEQGIRLYIVDNSG